MFKLSCYLFYFTVLLNLQSSICSLTINGSISVHSLIFDKIIKAFDHVLVKFDEPFSYGEKEDVFKEISKVSISASNFITATVGIADYSEKENADLSERFNIKKSDFPAYRLFNRDVHNPVVYNGDIKVDDIKLFLSKHTGLYMGLEGCLEEFDKLAREFVDLENLQDQQKIVDSMKTKANDLQLISDKKDHSSAMMYVKIASKALENGRIFIKNEQERLKKLFDGNVSDNKKLEIRMRLNVLQSFQSREKTVEKLEL